MWCELWMILGFALTLLNLALWVSQPKRCPHCGKPLVEGDNDPFSLFCMKCWGVFSVSGRK